jgi:uncharacterized membrane protein
MVSDTGSGLVELLTTKHIILFKNLKPSYDDDSVSVYRGGKVWVSISYHEAAVSMLRQSTICWHCTTLTTLLLIQHTGSTELKWSVS